MLVLPPEIALRLDHMRMKNSTKNGRARNAFGSEVTIPDLTEEESCVTQTKYSKYAEYSE